MSPHAGDNTHGFFGVRGGNGAPRAVNFSSNSFRRPEASFRIGARSSEDFARFDGIFLAMTLPEINSLYSTDERCRELLKKLRWPLGVECLRCKSKKVYDLPTQKKFECSECGYQFSVITQTIFNDTHLPLETWFMAVLLLVEARNGISANQVKRTLGISYKTAWYLCHRIRKAMAGAHKPKLNGVVEIDETCIGGKRRGGFAGHGSGNKEIVIGIRQHGDELRFFHAEDVKSGTLAKYIQEHVSTDVDVLMTDDCGAYPNAMKRAGHDPAKHKTINHSKKVYVQGYIYTKTVESAFSLLKRGIIGTWHKVSTKHLSAYLGEMSFRFNRRKRPDLFIDTLRHMVTADPLSFENLTKVVAY